MSDNKPAEQGASIGDMNRGFVIGTCDARSTPGKYPCSQHAGHNGWHQWETRNGSCGTFSVEPLPTPSAPVAYKCRSCNMTLTEAEKAVWVGCDVCEGEGLIEVPPSATPSTRRFPEWSEEHLRKMAAAEDEAGCINVGVPPSAPANGNNGIYIASRASVPERAARWRALRDSGVPVISTWIDEAGEGQTGNFAELWERIQHEVRDSKSLILYAEPDDFPLKGALIEVGMALAAGVRVYAVLPGVVLEPRSMRPVGSWLHHPLVSIESTVEEAIALSNVEPVVPPSAEGVVSLPELDITEEDRNAWGTDLPNGSLVASYRCRERQLLSALTSLTAAQEENAGLRKRIHHIEGHNQYFFRCESAWCNPDVKSNPALDNLKWAVERAEKAEAEVSSLRSQLAAKNRSSHD